MKSASPAMAAHLQGDLTSLVTCWRLRRTDGMGMFFTDFDQDLDIDGDIYEADKGYSRTAITNSDSFTVDNLDIIGYLDSDAITETDLLSGLYDHAQIHIFMVNWQDLSMGSIPLRTGWLGELSLIDQQFTAELRGLSQALLTQIGETYGPTCRADFGDGACTVDTAALMKKDQVAAVVSRREFILSDYAAEAGEPVGGVLSFTSGLNAGRRLEISHWQPGSQQVTLFLAAPFDIEPGDGVTVTRGCDKSFATCRDHFANQINFRGFPHIPGTDALTEDADA
ncbi:DUF2163 domain-containing protein [Sneathiella marina]|uniref:DUF2163 domain-containing protein n=1 Tax=Sneathiella marina TaxID=2950108 RepID=A0ABY4W3Q9_9PROT|nr:DUF2163 domain-containing protein [Sneathiella marina]USG59929.1 DUF2163 domain-containing protein [Sneathiella marina]